MSTLVVERPRSILRARGRDPVRMLHGLATADIEAVGPTRAAYTAFLTPKGRMVADARVFANPAAAGDAGDTEGAAAGPGAGPATGAELLIETHPAALPGLVEHLRKSVPPLFARFEDESERWRLIGVYGEEVGRVAAAGAAAVGDPPHELPADAAEDEVVPLGADPPALAVATRITGGPGWDLLVPAERATAVVDALVAAGGERSDTESLERLRVLAGRPRWGAELTADVIPLEAGLLERAISQSKGCYTGQEVIVRILHRGHVNRHLRRLEFRAALAEPGTELYEPDNERPRGVITSAVRTGTDGGGVGLGYVRREIDPPAELRVGAPDGPVVRVLDLG